MNVDHPADADPQAAVAWSACLQTGITSNDTFNIGMLIGRSTGEWCTLSFTGRGFVLVQPSELPPGGLVSVTGGGADSSGSRGDMSELTGSVRSVPGPLEIDTCRDYVLPKLKAAGWSDDQIVEQYPITAGRIVVVGSRHRRARPLRADYVLEYRPGVPVAVVEAKREYSIPGKGLQQAKNYGGCSTYPSPTPPTVRASSRTIATPARRSRG